MSGGPVSDEATRSRALREHVSIWRGTHTLAVRVSGADTFPLLERLCSSDLSVRDGRMLHTLVLSPEGSPAADLFVCADDEDCLVLVEGMTFAELCAVADEPETREGDDLPLDSATLRELRFTVSRAISQYALKIVALADEDDQLVRRVLAPIEDLRRKGR